MNWEVGQRVGEQWGLLGSSVGATPRDALKAWVASNEAEAGVKYGVRSPGSDRWYLFVIAPGGEIAEAEA